MENQVQKFLIKLRKIAQIPEGKRLDTTSGDIEILQDGWVDWIWRIAKNDGRVKAMDTLKAFYQEVVTMDNDLMETERIDISNLHSICKQLIASMQGLRNIKDCPRYKGDQRVSSVIDFIIEDLLTPHIQKLTEYLKGKGISISTVIVITQKGKTAAPISPGTSPAESSSVPDQKGGAKDIKENKETKSDKPKDPPKEPSPPTPPKEDKKDDKKEDTVKAEDSK